ncbi:MAG: nucleotidyltransferase domain-containing protein [Opitutales bacterium]|jgi:predicted nucleotidyltransferase
MNTGLSDRELVLICRVLESFPNLGKAVLFGSRAKGTARRNSDIDIAVFGLDSALDVERLSMVLDELPLPYKFDVVGFESIGNPALREHIERAGVALYEAGRSVTTS